MANVLYACIRYGIVGIALLAPAANAVRRQHAADLLHKTVGHHPVIVVGPLLGQTLEVKDERWLNFCSPLRPTWTTAWLNTGISALTCAIGVAGTPQLGLTFDSDTNRTSSPHNVQVRVAPGWKGLSLAGAEVYDALVKRLEAEGWKKDVDILPMPYDWRLGVEDWKQEAFPRMRALIEGAVQRSGSPVVLTGISMAAPFTHSFLMWMKKTVGASWAAGHVQSFVPVGGPFNGAVNALSAVVGGALLTFSTPKSAFDEARFLCPSCNPALDQVAPKNVTSDLQQSILEKLGVFVLDELKGDLTELVRGLPSIYWMSTGVDYSTSPPTDKTYVTLTKAAGKSSENVTASQMPSLFRRIEKPAEAALFDYALSVGTTEDPGVRTHCVYSYNVQTFAHLSFPEESDYSERAVVYLDDGDGTVHMDSLNVCERWKSTVRSYKIPGVPHASMMGVNQVLDVIVAAAKDDEGALAAWKSPDFVDLDVSPSPANNLTAWAVNLIDKVM